MIHSLKVCSVVDDFEQSVKNLISLSYILPLNLSIRTYWRHGEENESLGRAPLWSAGVKTKPSLSPLSAILKLYI